MTAPGPATAGADASLALDLLALAPVALGGAVLRGGGPLRDALTERLRTALPEGAPWRRLPLHTDDERLLGGVDIAASLAAGQAVRQRGLLSELGGGVLVVPLAERIEPHVAGRLAQALDQPASSGGFTLLLLDDGAGPDECPPAALSERTAFLLDLAEAREIAPPEAARDASLPLAVVAPLADAQLTILAATAEALGVGSARALLFADSTARAHAALHGRDVATEDDLATAARLVLAPRATRLPPAAEPPPDQIGQPDAPAHGDQSEDDVREPGETMPDELVLAAALAAIPPDLLARLAAGGAARQARGSGAGRRNRAAQRGKPLGARPGMPRGGARLALVDSLRAAVPWQALRRREDPARDPQQIIVRKDDLRVRRFEERAGAVTVFCVDASGSAAAARLAEAKGAVERLLAQSYVTRSEVALIAFRGTGAEVLLPPTRSLTRARRALAELPGGGGTPLASGLRLAHQLCDSVAARGNTPFLVLLTDGSANIDAAGAPGRPQARADASATARRIAVSGVATLLIDIAPRPRPEAASLANELRARYLPLPMADSAALERAVRGAAPPRAAA